MRNIFFLTLLSLLISATTMAQGFQPAPPDKAVVYFVRASSTGFAVGFSIYDGQQIIGRWAGVKYLRYECEPGEHVFWARSENRDYIQTDIEAGKVYVVEVYPTMGAMKAAVRLTPIDPTTSRRMKRITKVVDKKPPLDMSPTDAVALEGDHADRSTRGMNKYEEEKAQGLRFEQLKKEMSLEMN